VEHRLFGEISKHWAGQPLVDYPTVVRLIGETRTQTGLTRLSLLEQENGDFQGGQPRKALRSKGRFLKSRRLQT
jgi:hypothetical protein